MSEVATGAAPPRPVPRMARGLLALVTAALALGAGLYLRELRRPATIAGLTVGGTAAGGIAWGELPARVAAAAEHALGERIVLVAAGQELTRTRRDLGFRVDLARAAREAQAVGKSGQILDDLTVWARARRGGIDVPLHAEVEGARALDAIVDLKDDVDRAGVDAHLDLDHHTVAPERAGVLVDVYASLAAVEAAARRGQTRVELVVTSTPPRVKAEDLRDIDISTVLGSWETRYSSTGADTDRTYNLKVGAEHLNGHILKPHEVFSFNEVVGDRTEREGYRVAPVIAGGELIDGLAGGMCQIASTLHAAAFFAGLDIVSSRPHSRPSSYITMGLDSTVVYPSVDLKLSNPYDFPVVMHYTVNQGAVKVELLGKDRPYRVLFEREIKTERGFATEVRQDPEAPEGQRLTLQEGYPGFTIVRRRYVFEKDRLPGKLGAAGKDAPIAELLARLKVKPLKKEEWNLGYPSTTQIVAVGSGPKGKKKEPPPAHRIPPVSPSDKPFFRIAR